MNVVLDTNVIVSAFISPLGAPARVLDLALNGKAIIAYDDRILLEYKDVLSRRRFSFDTEKINSILDFCATKGKLIHPDALNVDLPDPSDLPFVEVAYSAAHAPIITGNKKHFPAKVLAKLGLKTMSPSEFLNSL